MPRPAIRLLVLDVDGVLTDGRLYFGARGESLKAFHVHDGQGIVELQRHGITVAVISGRRSRAVAARCRELGVAAYLTKPIRQSDLREAMLQVLGRRLVGQENAGLVTRHSLKEDMCAQPNRTILLAEDNPVNQRLTRRLLEKRGYRVGVVENGQEAVSAVQHQSFDVVLMDVQMPVMDGFEATALIREHEHVELRRPRYQLHTAVVDDDLAGLQFGKIRCCCAERFEEQAVPQFEDVCLVHAGERLASRGPGVLEGEAEEPPARYVRDDFDALHDAGHDLVLDRTVEVFGQFADKQDIHALEPGR